MDDRRKHPRTETDEPAYISSGGLSTRCRLLNISADGAAVEVPDSAFVPSHFQLMTEKDRMVRLCRIIWIKHNRIGIAFEQPDPDMPKGNL
ncbi:MAG: PilZ domain-containing protein [Proteobacteria bacterium]|nr:PilZ domain-containing protein [Pseudomonadota bacterium]